MSREKEPGHAKSKLFEGKWSPFRGAEFTGEDWERLHHFPWRAARAYGFDLVESTSMGFIFSTLIGPEWAAVGILAGEYIGYFGTTYLIKLSERTRMRNVTWSDRGAVGMDIIGEFGVPEVIDSFIRLPTYAGATWFNSKLSPSDIDNEAVRQTLDTFRDLGVILVGKIPNDILYHFYPTLYNSAKDWIQHRRSK